MENTPKSFEISYPENAHEAFAQENSPLPVEEWNPAWDKEIEAEKTNPSLLKRISDAIPTPVKAAAAGTVVGLTHLLNPSSAEARPVPPDWTPRQIAEAQDRLNFQLFNEGLGNNITTEELLLSIKNNMIRGEGVEIVSEIDVTLGRCGRIGGKSTKTTVTRSGGNWWDNRTGISDGRGIAVPEVGLYRVRMFDIISENGTVRKEYQGTREF